MGTEVVKIRPVYSAGTLRGVDSTCRPRKEDCRRRGESTSIDSCVFFVARVLSLVRGRVGKKVEMRAGPSCVIWKGSRLMESRWSKGAELEEDGKGFNTVVGLVALMLDRRAGRANVQEGETQRTQNLAW